MGVGAPLHMVSELRVQRIILRARQTLNLNFVLSPLLPSVTQFFDSQSPGSRTNAAILMSCGAGTRDGQQRDFTHSV